MFFKSGGKAAVVLTVALALLISSVASARETSAGLQKRAKEFNAGVKDIAGKMVVIDADSKGVRNINPSLIEALNVKEMDIFYRSPDQYRAEALAKGLQLTWVLNGNKQVISVPGMMIRKTEDVGQKPGRKRNSLDMGFISHKLWDDFNVSIVSQSKNSCQLKLVPNGEKEKRHEMIWIEPGSMKLVKRQRHSGDGTLSVSYIYSDHTKIGKLNVAERAKLYNGEGEFAGTVEYRGMKGNTGLAASLFSLSAR